MNLLSIYFTATSLALVFLAILTLFYFYNRTKEAYQLHLLLMSGSHFISLVFQVVNSFYPSETIVYIYSSFQLFVAFFAINASLFFSGKKPHLKYHLHILAGFLFVIIAFVSGLKSFIVVSVLYGLTGASIIFSGLNFFKYSQKSFFVKMFSVSLILWGLHKLDYILLFNSSSGQLIGNFLSNFLILLNVFFLIAWMFEENKIEILEKTNLLNHILENIPDIVVRFLEKNRNIEIVWASPNVTRLVGYTIEQLTKPEFLYEAIERKVIEDIRRQIIQEKKSSFSHIIPIKDAEGRIRYFEIKATKLRTGSEQGSYYDAVLTEITKLKMLERDFLRIEEILHRINMGIIVLDENNAVRYLNPFMEEILGIERNVLIGRNIDELKERVRMLDLCSIYERCLSFGSVDIDIEFGKEKKVFRANLIPTYDNNGRFVGEVMVFRDISELIRLEKIAERRLVIDEIRKNIGTVIHDFKNILASVIASLSLLKEKLKDGVDEPKILEESLNNLYRLNNLSLELLEISSPIVVKLNKYKITQIVESATTFLMPEEKERLNVFIEAGIEDIVTDERLLSRAIGNILRNAFDVSPSNMLVKLVIRTAVLSKRNKLLLKPGKYLVFSVSDRGPGISEEHMKNLFKPFFSEKKRSLGLGLYIAYSFVNALSGAINVQSVEGEGSTFEIYVPSIEKSDKKDFKCGQTLEIG